MIRICFALPLALTAICVTACSDVGTHHLAIAGDAAIQDGLASTELEDGWAVSFTSVVVVLHHPSLIERTDNEPTWVRNNGVRVWDVAAALAEGEELSDRIRATYYDGLDFRIAPTGASGYEPEAGNVESSVVTEMVDNGSSLRVAGEATDGAATLSFDWSFETDTLYRCAFADQGVTVEADGDETTTIEIQGAALFRTALGDAQAPMAFAAIAAADSNGDGEVTQAELEAVPFGDTGYSGEGVDSLWDYLEALSAEVGGVANFGACPTDF